MGKKEKKKCPLWVQNLVCVVVATIVGMSLNVWQRGIKILDRPQTEDVASVSVGWNDSGTWHTAEFSDREHINRACQQNGILQYIPLSFGIGADYDFQPETSISYHMKDGTERLLEVDAYYLYWNGKYYKCKNDTRLFLEITDVYFFNDTFSEKMP